MIKLMSGNEAKKLQDRVSKPEEGIEFHPKPSEYKTWIDRMAHFFLTKSESIFLRIEEYCGDLIFFDVQADDLHPIIFMSALVPLELVVFGNDWMVGISSYPEFEYSRKLEYSIRFYGEARVLWQIDN